MQKKIDALTLFGTALTRASQAETPEQRLIVAIIRQAASDAIKQQVRKDRKTGKKTKYWPHPDAHRFFYDGGLEAMTAWLALDADTVREFYEALRDQVLAGKRVIRYDSQTGAAYA